MSRTLGLLAVGLLSATVLGQSRQPRLPVIDMHVHASPTFSPERTLAILDSLNVRYIFLSNGPDSIGLWASVDATRLLPALTFPCAGRLLTGRSASAGPCVLRRVARTFQT